MRDTSRRRRAVCLAGMAVILSSISPVLATTPIILASHHAVYRLTLLKSTGSKAPQAIDGLLSYDFSGSACDGYAVTLRQMTALQPQDGDAHVSEMRTATYEDGEAHDYRFKVDTKGNADAHETIDGAAHKATDGGIVAVSLAKPQAEKLDLDAGVLFPTEHLKKVIATAEGGGKLLSAAVFDGSDTGKKVFDTLTVIGAETETQPTEKAAQIDALRQARRWPVTISYFDAAKTDAAPDYVLSFDLYENGISRALKLDYGDFVLAGELTDLKVQPNSACSQ